MRRVQSGQAGEQMMTPLAGQLGGAPFKYFADWTDRIAKGELPHAKPPRPQGVERNIVVTTWEWRRRQAVPPRPDRLGPPLSDGERLRPALRLARVQHRRRCRSSIRRRTRVTTFKAAGARCRHAGGARTRARARDRSRCSPRPTGATRRSGTRKANNHNAMFDRKGGVWFAAAVRGPDNPAFCKKGSDHPSAKLFPLERTNRHAHDARSEDDEVHVRRHLLRHASPAVRLRRQRHAVDQRRRPGGRLGQHEGCSTRRATRRRRRGGRRSSSTPTATAGATTYVEPDQPVDPAKDKRIAGGFYAVMPSPVDGSIWGSVGVFGGPRGGRAARCPAPNPPRHGARRNLQRAEAVLRHPRRRHRQAGRRVGVAGERPHGQLRPAEVQEARSTGRRPPAITAPRAGRSTSIPAPASRASARTAPSRATTRGSTSTTRSGSARTCRCRPPTSTTAWSR